MWVQDEDEDTAAADSDEEHAFSSEDEEDLQWHILEKQRDEANQRLSELEEASNQLLKEINVLEIQFQIERSCRESAEALALKVTKENKVLKRKSQMLMPLIAELPENLPDVTFDPAVNGDEVDGDEVDGDEVDGDEVDGAGGSSSEEMLLLESQAKITELQASVDGLLAEKLKLEQQVEDLTSEQTQLREQLALEVAEKEAILRKLNKQSKTVNKLKRVSQLVTDEFTEMSQKLELEQGLRQHAEVLATQMILEQKAAQASETDLKMQVQLEQALQQISQLSTALCDIQLYYQDRLKQSQSAVEESSALSELQNLREQLEKSEEERKTLETQLSDANSLVTQLQEEVKELQQTLNSDDKSDEPGEKAIPDFVSLSPLPPPPPPVAPPLPGCGTPTVIMNSGLAAVKIKKPIKTKFRMPVFNWVALKPNQINGTVFNEIDDERILEDLNVDEFEEMFKTKAQGPPIDLTASKQKVIQKGPNKVTLLDSNRAKNLAITLRKVGKTPEEICKGIQLFDLRTLPVDFVECLMRFQPTENEIKVLRQFEKERKPLESLTDEDRFMMQFSKIERLMQKMTIMAFIGNFAESVQMLTPQLHAVIAASVSIKSSQKLKKILEIILALGNYMNSSKRGAVYGFKLQSLDLLLDTKSTDRKQTLLHYIANVVREKYTQVSLFYNEMHYVEKAAAVSLENVLLDVKELQRGMELTKREYSMHGHNTMLKEFIAHNESKLKKLQDDAKIAQDAFDEVVKFFGENAKTTPPSVFFPVFVRFVKAYRQAEEDNEQRKRQEQIMLEKLMEQEAMMEEDQKSPSHKSKRQQQELIQELRRKQVKDSRHVYEGKDGAIEDIITALKKNNITKFPNVYSRVRNSSSSTPVVDVPQT
ncbi:formin-like protein 2 isoform X2 [Haplochromis burtoni]|uniref:formin-like protein 2 isoform X2 n=1 Tax=Haplochromis burtoni TaxID=8153 RepID=UPI001C2DDDB5|nr:formin-like protein 2 isoform X2 [Haplochromis burtoni]